MIRLEANASFPLKRSRRPSRISSSILPKAFMDVAEKVTYLQSAKCSASSTPIRPSDSLRGTRQSRHQSVCCARCPSQLPPSSGQWIAQSRAQRRILSSDCQAQRRGPQQGHRSLVCGPQQRRVVCCDCPASRSLRTKHSVDCGEVHRRTGNHRWASGSAGES